MFWGIGAGLGWILKPFPLRPPRSIAQRGKLIFLRSRKKERSGWRAERARGSFYTHQIFFNGAQWGEWTFSPPPCALAYRTMNRRKRPESAMPAALSGLRPWAGCSHLLVPQTRLPSGLPEQSQTRGPHPAPPCSLLSPQQAHSLSLSAYTQPRTLH